MIRKIKDGDLTGIKQDKFRNSRYEYDPKSLRHSSEGMSKKTQNTISSRGEDNPPSKILPDSFYNNRFHRGFKKYGGALLDHEGSHYGKGPKGYKRADEVLYNEVCETLTISPIVDASKIEVKVQNGIVYLDGVVSDRFSKKMAELEIENISGVTDVQNRLNLEGMEKLVH